MIVHLATSFLSIRSLSFFWYRVYGRETNISYNFHSYLRFILFSLFRLWVSITQLIIEDNRSLLGDYFFPLSLLFEHFAKNNCHKITLSVLLFVSECVAMASIPSQHEFKWFYHANFFWFLPMLLLYKSAQQSLTAENSLKLYPFDSWMNPAHHAMKHDPAWVSICVCWGELPNPGFIGH